MIPTIFILNCFRIFSSLIEIPSYQFNREREISLMVRFKSECFVDVTEIESSTCGFARISAILWPPAVHGLITLWLQP